MAYLFDTPTHVDVSVSVSSINHDEDILLLSHNTWNYLVDDPSCSPPVLLSISRLQPSGDPPDNEVREASRVTGWCKPDRTVSGLVVPQSWLNTHPKTFRPDELSPSNTEKSHRVSLLHPLPLAQVALLALSQGAYDVASNNSDKFEKWLTQIHPFLRQGDTIQIPSASLAEDAIGTLGYQVVETEPTKHGLVQSGITAVLLFSATSEDPRHLPEIEDEWTDPELDDSLEIDERFLGNSVLLSIPSHETAPNGNSVLNGNAHPRLNGEVAQRLQSSQEWVTDVEALSEPFSAHDDETIYLQTRDLSKIGVLNGDWAVVRPAKHTSSRLVRLVASDILVPSGKVLASPTLLHNIAKGSFSPPSSQVAHLGFRSSPFGSRRPAIPVARRVTVARIASPASVNKENEPVFLRALKSYFNRTVRLIKEGDVMGFAIDSHGKYASGDNEAYDNSEVDGSALPNLPHASTFPNEVVYFVVTNIEHDVVAVTGEILPADTYIGCTVGELGCWVDATVTRLVQSGVEHSLIPRSASYLGVMTSDSRLKSNKSYQSLFSLVSAAISKDAVKYHLELSVLLQGTRGIGKTTVAMSVAHALGLNHLEVNCFDILSESAVQSEAMLQIAFEKASACSPCMLILKHIDALGQATQNADPTKGLAIADALNQCMSDLQHAWVSTGFPVLVLATTAASEQVPMTISSLFKHQISMETPEDGERLDILETLLDDTAVNPDVSIKDLAMDTAAFVSRDLFDLTRRAKNSTAAQILHERNNLDLRSLQLKANDIDKALAKARENHAESIGAPQIPQVSWDDVGGIAEAKADILDTIQLPLEHPELFASGMKKRSGILLYGPPGTGKTLLAKAVATSCALNFFSVKGPELLNMYIGESEANVRRIFQKAKDARPCVIFFDELDSIAPKRGNHGDSGGVMDRIVSQLLAELDGVSGGEAGADVFVIGATNRPDLLDPALLRPGRFDRMLYLGVSTTNETQLNILHALTRKFKLHPDLDLTKIVEACPFHFTGADFYALCADALLRAMSRKAEEVDEKIRKLNVEPHPHSGHPYPLTPQYYLAEIAELADIEVLVSHEDFRISLENLVPSVSPEEMAHYSQVQRQFSANDLVNYVT